MDVYSNRRAVGDIFAPVPQPQFSHFQTQPGQSFSPASQRATLHYLPQERKRVDSSWKHQETDRLASSCWRDMDSVDEEMITRLCYALELDKLYVLPDLGLCADIVNRI